MITIELNLPINISLELQRVASQRNSRINRAASFTVIKLEVINNDRFWKSNPIVARAFDDERILPPSSSPQSTARRIYKRDPI